MNTFDYCETKLAARVGQLPGLTASAKSAIVKWLPLATLVLAIATGLLGGLLWERVGRVDRFSFVADVVVYILAYSALKVRPSRIGWSLLFYGTLVQVGYGVLAVMFGEGTVGSLIGRSVGVILIGWLLLQVRPVYVGK